MPYTAHLDTFARDHLPPPEAQPTFLFDLPELQFPERLNCATELLDRAVKEGQGDRPFRHHREQTDRKDRAAQAERKECWLAAEPVRHGARERCHHDDHHGRDGRKPKRIALADLAGRVPGFIVSDVSFISLKLALPPALAIAKPGAAGIFLVKPQFEAGREAIGKGGLLKDPFDAARVAGLLQDWLDAVPGWRSLGLHLSPIEGGDGNREFLLGGIKDR